MSYDHAIKWIMIAAIALLDLVLLAFLPLSIQWVELVAPASISGLIGVLVFRFHQRQSSPCLVLFGVSFIQLSCLVIALTLLIYETAMFRFPLQDDWLRQADATLGYYPRPLVQWIRQRPTLDQWSTCIYQNAGPQMMVMLLALSLFYQRKRVEQFILQMIISLFVCAIFAGFFPAAGPLYNNGITPFDWQQGYLNDLAALRSGEHFHFRWSRSEGIVTFPSFHTCWAILVLFGWLRTTRWLSVPLIVLNVVVVATTLTTGEHYFVDVAGGGLLAVLSIWLSHRISAYCYNPDGSPRMITIPDLMGYLPLKPSLSLR